MDASPHGPKSECENSFAIERKLSRVSGASEPEGMRSSTASRTISRGSSAARPSPWIPD